VLDAADDARIAALPHRIGQHAYYTLTVGVTLRRSVSLACTLLLLLLKRRRRLALRPTIKLGARV